MSPSQKKQRISAVVIKHAVSTTDSGEKLQNLLTWLKSCGTKGLEDGRFNFIGSDGQCGGSLGGFAAMDYAVGDLLFAIPLSCILSLSNSRNSKVTNLVRDAAKAFGEPALVTSELLIWLCMIQHLDDSSSHFNPFLQSLDSDSPSPLSWPKELAAALLGTNMSTMTSPFTSVQKHSEFLNETRRWAQETNIDCSFLSPEKYNVTSLIWARGHYLARRYPGKFSININTQSSDGTEDSESNNIEEDTISKDDGREPGMMNLGALVPLLDILNHDPEREWLTFKVLDGFLHVTCNYPVAKGSELYSNYGSLSNEMLLHAYGFCLEKNDDDAVTLQLMGVGVDPVNNNTTGGNDSIPDNSVDLTDSNNTNSAKHFGTYYVRSGGMAGVPNELWKQLTSLIGEDFDEGVEDGDEDSIEPDSAIVDDAETVAVRSSHISVSSDVDQVVSQDSNGCSGDEDDSEDDEEAPAVEVGIEECEMLRDCLQRKLDLLLSTEESARQILDSFDDPRALYVRWYRDGQSRVLTEALDALSDIIGADNDQEE